MMQRIPGLMKDVLGFKPMTSLFQGLPPSKVSDWFAQFPVSKVPLLGTDGQKYREAQLSHQVSPPAHSPVLIT